MLVQPSPIHWLQWFTEGFMYLCLSHTHKAGREVEIALVACFCQHWWILSPSAKCLVPPQICGGGWTSCFDSSVPPHEHIYHKHSSFLHGCWQLGSRCSCYISALSMLYSDFPPDTIKPWTPTSLMLIPWAQLFVLKRKHTKDQIQKPLSEICFLYKDFLHACFHRHLE